MCPNQASGAPLRKVLRCAGFSGKCSDRHAFAPSGVVYERKVKWAEDVLAVPLGHTAAPPRTAPSLPNEERCEWAEWEPRMGQWAVSNTELDSLKTEWTILGGMDIFRPFQIFRPC